MSKYMVFVQDTFAGINVTDKALQRKSTELMLKYDGRCIDAFDKGAQLQFPTYSKAINFVRDNNKLMKMNVSTYDGLRAPR